MLYKLKMLIFEIVTISFLYVLFGILSATSFVYHDFFFILDQLSLKNLERNVKIVQCHHHIWNHHEKYIEISTNIPVIGSLICEITVKVSENM